MKCAASKIEVEMMSDNSVRLTLRCNSSYEASILYHEIDDALMSGSLELQFDSVTKRTKAV